MLALLPLLTQAKENLPDWTWLNSLATGKIPDPGSRACLLKVEKVAGTDWTVTAIPHGYLLTYRTPVCFYNPISSNSKISKYQQIVHGHADHLRIKIIFGPCLTGEERQQYDAQTQEVPSPVGLKNAPGYFLCRSRSRPAISGGNTEIALVTNYSPYLSVASEDTQYAYDDAVEGLGLLFHCFQPIIIDG